VHFEPISTILLEDDDDHTNDIVVDADADVDDDDDDADDDEDPVELFQKRGKWWEGVDRNHSIGIYLYIIISN
jgi:hypothetical protein